MPRTTHSFRRRYAAAPASVPAARRAAAAFAVEIGAHPGQVAAVRLAVSEAVTNAVLHGYQDAPGDIRVTAEVAGDQLTVAVCDEGRGMHASSERSGMGVGLGLIAEVADGMTIVPRRDGGVELRMRFALTAARATSPELARPGQVVGERPSRL